MKNIVAVIAIVISLTACAKFEPEQMAGLYECQWWSNVHNEVIETEELLYIEPYIEGKVAY